VGWAGLLAALAVCRALEEIGLRTGMKWPNDVVVDGKKLAGVLVEMVAGRELAAVGVGLNVSNPLPPAKRKPGTVGPSGGPEIRVVDETGTTVPHGATGEIVIRGPNVMREYENNPKANADAFYDGWFRTGDQGVMDEDGYVAITGRVEGDHQPRRREDFAARGRRDHHGASRRAPVRHFRVPHEMLGEEVAGDRMKQGTEATDREPRDFASTCLAPFKVPRKILILTEIPVGATGKLQRIGLAQKLGCRNGDCTEGEAAGASGPCSLSTRRSVPWSGPSNPDPRVLSKR
jgi:acyl-CoA synthetase (AMP-forming)/AMP-acid ligase II